MKIFDQQLEEKKYSVKIKVLIIFQFLAFSSIIESKKGELCSKHYQEFKEISDKSILLVENIGKKYEKLFNYYKYSDCSCKKVLEKIFKSMKFISEQLKEKKDNEKLELFDTLLKENKENFCDNHQKFYESFSNFSLFHE